MAGVEVREAEASDAGSISAVYSHYVTDSVATFEEEPPPGEDFLRRMRSEPRLPWLVADADGEFVGHAYASKHRDRAGYRWSVDVSVYLADGQQGRGIGRLLYARLLPEVAALGYVSAYAGIALPNAGSVALHESMGFELVGVYRDVGFKHGRWIDVGWWSLQLASPSPVPPPEPLGWHHLI